MEHSLGHDFRAVRVHTGSAAAASAARLQARAFTVGEDIVFGAGARGRGDAGSSLLAHELVHVVQQRRSGPRVDRAPKKPAGPDPLCAGLDATAAVLLALTRIASSALATDAESRRALILSLKPVRRCATSEQQQTVREQLVGELGPEQAEAVWADAGKAFSGYVGMFPGYASDIKRQLKAMGTSETVSFGSFELSASGRRHRERARREATAATSDLARTDILYFRGHQFAQYRAPGVFSDGAEERGFDLRYVEQAGGFGNVKLLISTSCATLCKEAFDVFHALFPNAVILGYRRSAPIEGARVRRDFARAINALGRGLLLDQAVDVDAIVATWRSVAERRHRGQKKPQPAIFRGGNVEFFDGKAWQTVAPSSEDNACAFKRDFSDQYPAPETAPPAAA